MIPYRPRARLPALYIIVWMALAWAAVSVGVAALVVAIGDGALR